MWQAGENVEANRPRTSQLLYISYLYRQSPDESAAASLQASFNRTVLIWSVII